MMRGGAHLGGQHRQHGVARPDNATIPSEGQVGPGQDNTRISHLAAHIWTSFLQNVQGDHTSINNYMVTYLHHL